MRKKNSKAAPCPHGARSDCPVSNVLDVLGDKWTLIVLRDMLLFEKKLYSEFAESDEGIPTNILADRLRRLEAAGILAKKIYQERPTRYSYHLTAKGLELFPILKEIILWGARHISGLPRRDPAIFAEIEKRIRRQVRESARNPGK